ncbi:competence type IV pilus ATPase ComGA [Bacillus sp. FJAT-18017]|uniref:competence type IV pilus ATPase ComGA n=1 Tax=Bacillus sp. FJAT-18017 TaxID=1705566 RepID=UPI000B1673B2|nr:competence type IV pilus ATPase ComGA [Bacillus sp. FJAT-18017]
MLQIPSIIEDLAERIISDAVRQQATDIHILPRKTDTLIQLRITNSLIPRLTLPIDQCEKLISHFKFIAHMDIGERRKPQNGSIISTVDGKTFGLRLSTLPSNNRESLVIRLLPQNETFSFETLSLFPDMSLKLFNLLKAAHGMIILTGPTGSGKTTTLYSLLNETAKRQQRSIITLEDPIEKECSTVLQVQVNEKAGVTYAAGLRAILRHDPDIIMVGEIRDSETAKVAIRAALTGHLVLSTMHTRNAPGAIYRLQEFGVNQLEIEQTLLAVTAQRIVELVCPFCGGEECSPYCASSHGRKRASVFELLSGKSLEEAIKASMGDRKKPIYRSLDYYIKKGIVLGYIKEREYERLVYSNVEE